MGLEALLTAGWRFRLAVCVQKDMKSAVSCTLDWLAKQDVDSLICLMYVSQYRVGRREREREKKVVCVR